jgi:hypothetical protein
LRQHGVHGHKSPWKKFEWHVKPQYMVERLVAKHTAHLGMDHGEEIVVFNNANNGTSSTASSYALQESGGASGLGGLAALSGLVDVKPRAVFDIKFEAIPHIGAPSATLAQATAADREIVFPVCEAEPMACTNICMYRVELVVKRCMAWLHVSDARGGSDALERSVNTKATACESALTAARGAGAYTRPLFSSIRAVLGTKYTLQTPQHPPTPTNTPRHLPNTRKTIPKQSLNAPTIPHKALTLS